ncbi:MAG: PQQ-binding-like beta-propeller repeat protein [Acidobacteriota bacterium]
MIHKKLDLMCIMALALAGSLVASAAAAADGWPTWSGPEGNLTSLGNGLLDAGEFGTEVVWSRPLGSSYSGILAAGGHLVTTFSDGESDVLVALDPSTGAERWRYRISEAYLGHDGSDDGPLSTPTVAGGMVYGLGARGELFAVSLDDGRERWRLDLVDAVGAVKPSFGFSTAPVVVGDVLVVETGGSDGRAVTAFDRRTGERRWSAGDDTVTYQSPMPLRLGGETSLVAVTDRMLLGLAPDTGEELWRHRHTEGDGRGFGSTQPVPVGEGGILLIDGGESALFKVRRDASGYAVEEAWRSNALRSRGNFAEAVPYGGYLYGFSGQFLTCVDAATGETVWKSRPPGQGNLVMVDGHLVILARTGEVVVVKATPDGYFEVSRVQALDRGYFTRPSFADGRVYVRNLTDIAAVGVTEATPVDSKVAASDERQLLGEFGAFIRELEATDKKSERIDRFLAEHPTAPILEGDLVHFVYRGEVEDLAVSGNFIRGGGADPMHRVDGTDFYFRSYRLPKASIYIYRFSIFEENKIDPRNATTTEISGNELSVLTTAGWRAPAHLREPEGPRGRFETLPWKSEILDNEREVQIYLPPGYGEGADENDRRYPLLVINDGEQAVEAGQLDRSLDNLTGDTVAPMIVALVPRASWREFGGSETANYTRALVEELVPLIDRTYRTDARPAARAVMGQSRFGGPPAAAVYAVLHHPETFSRVAAQSFQLGENKEALLAAAGALPEPGQPQDGQSSEARDLTLVFHWSSHDTYRPLFNFDARRDAQEMVAALEERGYRPTVFESDDGVGWGMWQDQMAEILEALFPLE